MGNFKENAVIGHIINGDGLAVKSICWAITRTRYGSQYLRNKWSISSTSRTLALEGIVSGGSLGLAGIEPGQENTRPRFRKRQDLRVTGYDGAFWPPGAHIAYGALPGNLFLLWFSV